MTQEDKILSRISKFLKLAQSSNQHEAALALARATELMAEHQIEEATVRLRDTGQAVEVVGVADTVGKFRSIDRWRAVVATGVCDGLGIKYYWDNITPTEEEKQAAGDKVRAKLAKSPSFSMLFEAQQLDMISKELRKEIRKITNSGVRFVGKASVASTAAYMFLYIESEIERLCKLEYSQLRVRPLAAAATAWYNSFKVGAALMISQRMAQTRRDTLAKGRGSDYSQALVLVKSDEMVVASFYEAHAKKIGIHSLGGGLSIKDNQAYASGAAAARSINLGGGGAALGAGAKALGSGR